MTPTPNASFGPPPIYTPASSTGKDLPHQAWAQWFSQIFSRLGWTSILQANAAVANVSTPRLFQCTQANLATVAGGLTAADVGTLVWVTDYNHVLEWTGTGWQWGPGDSGSGWTAAFTVAPTGNGWHACDGSTVNYLKSDGTTGSAAVPNTAGSYFRQ